MNIVDNNTHIHQHLSTFADSLKTPQNSHLVATILEAIGDVNAKIEQLKGYDYFGSGSETSQNLWLAIQFLVPTSARESGDVTEVLADVLQDIDINSRIVDNNGDVRVEFSIKDANQYLNSVK